MVNNNVNKSFNVSNPETYSINELADIALKTLNKSHWNIIYSSPELDGQYRKDVSITKMNKILPNFTFTKFADGIKKVYENKK